MLEYTRIHAHAQGQGHHRRFHVLVILACLSFIIFSVAIIIALISLHFVLLAIHVYFSVLCSSYYGVHGGLLKARSGRTITAAFFEA